MDDHLLYTVHDLTLKYTVKSFAAFRVIKFFLKCFTNFPDWRFDSVFYLSPAKVLFRLSGGS